MDNPFIEKLCHAIDRLNAQRELCNQSARILCDALLHGKREEAKAALTVCNNDIIKLTVCEISRDVAARNLEKSRMLERELAERRVS